MVRRATAGWLLLGIGGADALAVALGSGATIAVALIAAAVGLALVLLPGEAPLPAAGPEPQEPRVDATSLLMDAIDDPMLLVVAGDVAQANAAARMLFGEHVLDEDFRLAIRSPAAAECLARAVPGVPCRVMLDAVGSDARRYELQASFAGEDARLIRLIDRASAAVVEKVRTDFVANASHELRTPLSTLLGFIETLQDSGAGDAPTRQRFLKIMMGEARRMQQLVDDLISLSRIEGERFSAPNSPVALPPLVDEVRNTILAGQRLPPERIVIAVQASDAVVPGDRGQLGQLLHNLIGNALKYGRTGGTVRVTIGAVEGRPVVLLQVADEGDGIAPEHLPRITERFYRVDPGRSRALGGTGLGLAIVKHIVERHRGRLQIDSRKGTGTTVTVALPQLAVADRP